MAHGLQPRALWSSGSFSVSAVHLSAGLCAFAEASVRGAESSADSGVIFATACDQMRRGYDALAGRRPAGAFLFNVPATWQSPSALKLFRSELERLGRFLEQLGGRPPEPEALARAIEHFTRARRQLAEARPAFSSRQHAQAVTYFHWTGSVRLPDKPSPPPASAVPVAIVGGPLPGPQQHVLDLVETAGARIVLNATESGERGLLPEIRLEAGCADPIDALARGYLENCADVFQRPNTRLYEWLKHRLAPRNVRGIILWHYVGCDLWRAEAEHLREAFGFPVLLIEADEVESGSPRCAGRIEAFVEMLT